MLLLNMINMIEKYSKESKNMSLEEKHVFQQDFNELYNNIDFSKIGNQGLQLELVLAKQEINNQLNLELMVFQEQERLRLQMEQVERERELQRVENDRGFVEKGYDIMDSMPGLIGMMSKAMK